MTTESDDNYREDAREAWQPAIDGMDDGDESDDTGDGSGHIDEWRDFVTTKPSESDETTESTDEESDEDSDSETDDTPESEWKTASGEPLALPEAHESHASSRNWSFGVVRVVRVVVGAIALFVLLFDFNGTFQRAATNPVLLAMAIAAVGQLGISEDFQQLRSLLGR